MIKIEELPRYYTILFDAVTKALDAIGLQNFGIAAHILVKGQMDAENAYIQATQSEDEDT